MNRRSLLETLGLVGLSGCLRLQSGRSDGTATPPDGTRLTGTGQQATTPDNKGTNSPIPGTPSYPNGLSDTGATEFLFPAHTRALSWTSFKAQWTKLNMTQSVIPFQQEYEVEPSTALGRWASPDGGEVRMYRAPEGSYWRENLGDRSTYGQDGKGFNIGTVSWRVEIMPFINAADWTEPTLVNESQETLWEVTANTVADESATPGYHAVELLDIDSATMRVDGNGVIRSLETRYRVREVDGEELQYSTKFSIDALGEVTVTGPSWLSTAKERTPRVSAAFTDDRRFVRFVIESGNRIEGNSRIVVFPDDPATRTKVPIQNPIEPGTQVYLYREARPEDSPVQGKIARGSKPSDASPVPFDGPYELTAYRRTRNYFRAIPVT